MYNRWGGLVKTLFAPYQNDWAGTGEDDNALLPTPTSSSLSPTTAEMQSPGSWKSSTRMMPQALGEAGLNVRHRITLPAWV